MNKDDKKRVYPDVKRRWIRAERKYNVQTKKPIRTRTDPKSVGFDDLIVDESTSKPVRLEDVWKFSSSEYDKKPNSLSSLVYVRITKLVTVLKKLIKRIAHTVNKNRNSRLALISIGVVLVLISFWVINKQQSTESILGVRDGYKLTSHDAGFEVLTPSSDEALGTDEYDPDTSTVTFQDFIDGNKLVITQQEAPQDIKENSSKLKDLASTSLGAIEIHEYFSSKGVFYILNFKNNSQTVMFTIEELLVFITSEQRIDSSKWTNYIDALN